VTLKRSLSSLLAATAAAALAAAGMLTGSAVADPPGGVTPHHASLVGVGAQTTEDLQNQLALDYNGHFANGGRLYSFDAEGSTTIVPKTGCAAIGRPNGANAGITALEANAHPKNDTTDYCVDYARGSRPRAATDPQSIVFIPFAVDAVTWTADKSSGKSNAPTNLTTAELHAIYSCDASTLGAGLTGPVTWSEVGGTSNAQVVPVIPPSTAGTRSFFLSEIGVTTLGSCVKGQDNSVEQNEGTNSIFTGADAPNIVFPYSVAVYLAQTVHNHGAGDQGSLILRKVDGTSPTSGTGAAKKLNENFGFVRTVNNVVRNANGTSPNYAIPHYLQRLLGNGTVGTGWLCSNEQARSEIRSFGFRPYTDCGELQ
jgi:ABC-type phosphate transport system substrate-binding protein